MNKSKKTSLTLAEKATRQDNIKIKKKLYHDAIERTVEYFASMDITITYVQEFQFYQNYRFDYYIPELGLAIEFEGGSGWAGHAKHNRFLSDLDKYRQAVISGYPVLRFIEEDLQFVFIKIYMFYKERSAHLGGKLEQTSPQIARLNAARLSPDFELKNQKNE